MAIATEPPAASVSAAPLLPLDRRSLLRGGALGAGLVVAASPLGAQAAERGFTSGVASGEPGADRVLLWTRYVAGADTPLRWEVAEAADFARVVAGGTASAAPDRDFCCKVVATGLAPGRWYYYRFLAPDGTASDIGRTRTLPQGRADRFRLAVFSCSNIGFGWFNAYAHAAAADEFDCVLHLGDYLYEFAPGIYPSRAATLEGREVDPLHELVALADYRARYAQYRRDPDLRRLHQLYPMISGWDDHETANDSWKDGAENHQPGRRAEGDWSARKLAATRAYREWMPVSDEDWAAYQIGDLATLFRLETRLSARDEPFSLAAVLAGKAAPDAAMAALDSFRDGRFRDPAREVLGAEQQGWLAAGLAASRKGGTVWQVLVQQVLMGALRSPTGFAEMAGSDTPDYLRRRLASGAAASRAGLPLNMDAWDGYPAARSRLLRAAQEADANLISLAGDTHNGWAFDLSEGGRPAGVEFGGQSVTSPGLENFLPSAAPDRMAALLREANPGLRFVDTARRGYMALDLTRKAARCEYRFVTNVRERGATLAGTHSLTTLPGRRVIAGA